MRSVPDLWLMVKQLADTSSIFYIVVNEVEPRAATDVVASCVALTYSDIRVCSSRITDSAVNHSIARTPESFKYRTIVYETRILSNNYVQYCDI